MAILDLARLFAHLLLAKLGFTVLWKLSQALLQICVFFCHSLHSTVLHFSKNSLPSYFRMHFSSSYLLSSQWLYLSQSIFLSNYFSASYFPSPIFTIFTVIFLFTFKSFTCFPAITSPQPLFSLSLTFKPFHISLHHSLPFPSPSFILLLKSVYSSSFIIIKIILKHFLYMLHYVSHFPLWPPTQLSTCNKLHISRIKGKQEFPFFLTSRISWVQFILSNSYLSFQWVSPDSPRTRFGLFSTLSHFYFVNVWKVQYMHFMQ